MTGTAASDTTGPTPSPRGVRRLFARRGRVSWPRRVARMLLVLSLLANVWLWSGRDKNPIGSWRSEAGRHEYIAAYDRVMATMPKPARTADVPTDYGIVRAYLFTTPQNAGKTPVVLLPGWGSGAPMWKDNLPDLIEERPVYAFDALGDAGMSTQTVPLDSPAAAAAWVDHVLGGLQIDRAHIVGHSFGGWTAMNFAIHHPERVASLSLLDPVQTFSALRWQIYVKSIPAALPILPQSWRDKALADIGGADKIDANDPMTQMISAGTEHYESKRSFPSRFTETQLRGLQVPVYAAMAGSSAVNDDPDQAVDFAKSVLDNVDIRVWPSASHSLPMEKPRPIDRELLAFMAQYDSP